MSEKTDIRIIKRFEGGQTGDVAVGDIDENGWINIHRVAPGQEDSVSQLIQELNQTDLTYSKTMSMVEVGGGLEDGPGADTEPQLESRVSKVAHARGSEGFFQGLREMVSRFYALELVFEDASLIDAIRTGVAAKEAERAAEAQAKADAKAAAAAEHEAWLAETKAALDAQAAALEEGDEESDETAT